LRRAGLVGGDPQTPGPAGTRRARGSTALAAGIAAALAAGTAHAGGSDGIYGRFDGDLELRVHAGAAFALGGPSLAAQLSALYLSTVGIYAHYTDALGSDAPRVARSVSTGVHLAPLFLARGGLNAERGPAFVDLLVDSLAFELGAFWSALPRAPWDEHPGLEAALSVDVPLFPRATGPFIGVRGALRWRPVDFAPSAPTDALDRGAVLSLTLGWHQVVLTHLVDPGDLLQR
jgi:hypothetical protein